MVNAVINKPLTSNKMVSRISFDSDLCIGLYTALSWIKKDTKKAASKIDDHRWKKREKYKSMTFVTKKL